MSGLLLSAQVATSSLATRDQSADSGSPWSHRPGRPLLRVTRVLVRNSHVENSCAAVPVCTD